MADVLSSSTSSSTVTSKRLSGVRGIRSVASESWDDDFLWQHSSSSDLHLPSSSSRHHAHQNAKDHRHRSSSSRSTLTNISSNTSTSGNLPGNRLSRSSSVSTGSSMMAWGYASRLSLQEDLDGLELEEEGEGQADEDPTITLNNAKLGNGSGTPQNRPRPGVPMQRASTSPAVPLHRKSYSPAKSHRPASSANRRSQPVPPHPNSRSTDGQASSPDNLTLPASSPPLSLASWRSPTPSLTSDIERSRCETSSSSSSTETDNETEHENEADIDNLVEVGNGSMSSTGTSGNNTPRLGFASLFGRNRGNSGSAKTETGKEGRKKSGSISISTPLFGRKNSTRASNTKRKNTIVADQTSSQGNGSGRLPFTRTISSSTSTSSSAQSAVYGTSPPSSYLSSSFSNSYTGTPTILSLKEQIQNNRTIRARQNSSNPPSSASTDKQMYTPPTSASPTHLPQDWASSAKAMEDDPGDVFSGIDDLDTDQETSPPPQLALSSAYPYTGAAAISKTKQRPDMSTSSLASTASYASTNAAAASNNAEMTRNATMRRKLTKRPTSGTNALPSAAAIPGISFVETAAPLPESTRATADTSTTARSSRGRPQAPPSPVASTGETTSSSTTAKTKRRSYRFPVPIRRRTTAPDTRVSAGETVESSADEAGFSPARPSPNNAVFNGSTSGGKGKERMPFANDSEADSMLDQVIVSTVGDASVEKGGWLSNAVSKRFSKEIKVSKVPFPSPDRKRTGVLPTTAESTISDTKEEVPKKPRRPLSLTAMLSRSISSSNYKTEPSRPLQSNTSVGQYPLVYNSKISPSPTSSVFNLGSSGTFARKKFTHRSTASSGNIPTAKSLLSSSGGLGRRQSVDFGDTLKAPSVIQRRSFNPLLRHAASPAIQERPLSSLSLLSETSTVRPIPSPLPDFAVRATSQSTSDDIGPPTLRRRHLPSLSLSLLPGATSSTPPRTALPTASLPLPSPSNLARPYTAGANSPSGSGYFGTPPSQTISATGLSIANSPGGRSINSSGSGRSTGGYLVRRVSLSDLRIPPRISNAQAKIGQDLQRVKEFKDGVEELKRLRNVYRSLVSSEITPDTSSVTDADVSGTSDQSSLFIPAELGAKVDHIFARVAVDYRKWWEIADVLINLADGAEVEETEGKDESEGSPGRRARCKSELPGRGLSISPTHSRSSLQQEVHPMPKSVPQLLTIKPASDEGVDVPTPESTISPASRPNLPLQLLARSQSTSSLSPRSAMAGLSPNGDYGISRKVDLGLEDSFMSVSDRQLDILRSMLKPQERSSPSTPVSYEMPNSPSSGTPSSPEHRSQSVIHSKPYLTPEKRLPTSFSLPSDLSTTPTSTPPNLPQSSLDSPASNATPSNTTPSSNVEAPSGGQSKSRSRLREVSRAGMLGIREFLKALKRNGVNITLEPSPEAASAAIQSKPRSDTVSRPSPARRIMSDPQVSFSQRGDCGHRTPVKNNLMAATLALGEIKGSPLSLRSGSSSDEEEDWDRRSSEDEEEDRGQDDSPSRGGPISRSDTQATILASMSLSADPTAASKRMKGKSATTRDRRGRTFSTNSTTTLTLPGNWTMGAKLVMTTEAMPTLLAKIDEVKLHCSTCVTELRNVTV